MDNLLKYLSISTMHPNPNYEAVINFFMKLTLQDSLETQKVILPSGLPVLIIKYEGSDKSLSSLALNHHMDTVDIHDLGQWKYSPFGQVVDQNIYGRGAQDMKGVGIVHYNVLKTLKKNNIKLKRSLYMIIVPDEEVGGFKGTKEFLETEEFNKLNIGYVIDEGLPSDSDKSLYIKISERRPIQIRVTSLGTMGHASKLFGYNCTHELIKFLSELVSFQEEQRTKATCIDAGKFLSVNITSLLCGLNNGFVSLNVIPNKVTATIDLRVPNQMDLSEVYQYINQMVSNFPNITYEVLAVADERNTFDMQNSELYNTLQESIKNNGFNVEPLHFEASTDLRFYLNKGIQGLGFTPFSCKDNLHGVDENITINDLVQGTNIFYDFVYKFCLGVK